MINESGFVEKNSPVCGISIQNAITRFGFPLVMQIRRHVNKLQSSSVDENLDLNDNNETQDGLLEMHSIQACWDVKNLMIINNYGERRKIQETQMSEVNYYIKIFNETSYKSLREIREVYVSNKLPSRWLVCLANGKSIEGVGLRPGQIFKIVSFSSGLFCCFKKNEDLVKIKIYPSKQRYWMSLSLRGDLRCCEYPGRPSKGKIKNLLENENLPVMIKQANEIVYSCLIGACKEKVLVSCTLDQNVHVFPEKECLLIALYPDALTWDTLTDEELGNIKSHALSDSKCLNFFTKEYSQLGIFRRAKKTDVRYQTVKNPHVPIVPLKAQNEHPMSSHASTLTHSISSRSNVPEMPKHPLNNLPKEINEKIKTTDQDMSVGIKIKREEEYLAPKELTTDQQEEKIKERIVPIALKRKPQISLKERYEPGHVAANTVFESENNGYEMMLRKHTKSGNLIHVKGKKDGPRAPASKPNIDFDDTSGRSILLRERRKAYAWTPILYDPDDNDTEDDDDDEKQPIIQNTYSSDSFDSITDDYENATRIRMNRLTLPRS